MMLNMFPPFITYLIFQNTLLQLFLSVNTQSVAIFEQIFVKKYRSMKNNCASDAYKSYNICPG